MWAGTVSKSDFTIKLKLKSAPPVWAGTLTRAFIVIRDLLKSAPPVWAGTVSVERLQQGS